MLLWKLRLGTIGHHALPRAAQTRRQPAGYPKASAPPPLAPYFHYLRLHRYENGLAHELHDIKSLQQAKSPFSLHSQYTYTYIHLTPLYDD